MQSSNADLLPTSFLSQINPFGQVPAFKDDELFLV